MASKLVLQRRLLRFLQLLAPSSSSSTHVVPFLSVKASECTSLCRKNSLLPSRSYYSRNLSSGSFNLDESQAPLAVDYRSLLDESEFHRLADSTIHSVQEKLEDYGDLVEVDGFDIDYGNDVLTVKLGDLGTYVLNKQTPNRQLWLSSPLSGPSRFDWDRDTKAWIYRRNKANLYKILEGLMRLLLNFEFVQSYKSTHPLLVFFPVLQLSGDSDYVYVQFNIVNNLSIYIYIVNSSFVFSSLFSFGITISKLDIGIRYKNITSLFCTPC
ncbi:uncharacterized protein LOC106753999 isoform X2 [Vigna radiata var. radiata]|uniref:ferroxidase n=1 Tax=Vigna radiata var. radiata TaxID=3916 RepID=A0A3Q0ET10_VIGRR|nr:uncharacterized protein LOC106753999 isoform X2 [Vigna radiata var. radiata]